MSLPTLIQLARRRWRLLVALPLLGAVLAIAATTLVTPLYESRTKLFVSASTSNVASDLVQGNAFTQARVRSYVDLVTTDVVLRPVVDQLGLEGTTTDLAERVSGGTALDTVMVDIRVTDPSPERAVQLADAVAASLVEQVAVLERPADGASSSVRLSVVEPAGLPESPVSPDRAMALALGLFTGLGLAVVYLVLVEMLDTRVRTADQAAELLAAPVLAALQTSPEMTSRWLVCDETGFSSQAEALRRLRTNLQFLDLQSQRRSFVITSSVAGEGKTTVSVNLALTLAAAGQRVVLVDADLRRPRVADYLGLEGAVGLTTVLIGQADLQDVLQPWGPGGGVDFLASGALPPNPSELLGSAEMDGLVRRLESEYDVVLIDSPPALPVTDPSVLASLCSGAIVVVSAGIARRDQLAVVRTSLEAVGGRLLGVVANRLSTSTGAYGGYGSYEQDYGSLPAPLAPAVPRPRGVSRLVPALRRG